MAGINSISSVPILMYHQVVNGKPGDIHAVSTESFEMQMSWLHGSGYETVLIDDASHESLLPQNQSPKRRIAISFDDGYLDAFENAAPILSRFGFSATIFLVAGRVGLKNDWDVSPVLRDASLMDWKQVRALRDLGMRFGAHTCTHPDLTAVTDHQAEWEIRTARTIIEDKLGNPVRAFAYPYSRFTAATIGHVADAGYTAACTYIPGFVGGAGNRPLALRRTGILATDTLDDFARKVRAAVKLRIRYHWNTINKLLNR